MGYDLLIFSLVDSEVYKLEVSDGVSWSNLQNENLHFEVDSHLLLELGERLVAKPSIALAELVKNSYDADALSVTITFTKVHNKGGTIIVDDTGQGMTFNDLKEKWMRIGTDYKERNPVSPVYGRTRTGRKGIGRFACRMISENLVLISVAMVDSEKERVKAVFNWDKLVSGKEVSEFEIKTTREKVPPSTQTGTKLVLEGTRTPWGEEDILKFKREILGLVNPFPWKTEEKPAKGSKRHDPGMEINVEAPEYPEIEGLLSRNILKAAWGKLEGSLDKHGATTYHLTITLTGEEYDFCPPDRFKELGPIEFTVYMFSLGELVPEVPGLTLTDLRRLGQEHGGVKVFLDGFRVFRYGEPGDDWLRLEFDRSRRQTTTRTELLEEAKGLKRPMLSLPGNNQLFGAVFLSREMNPEISLTVTRDRLLENVAFDELRKFVRLAIDWMTVKYAAFRAMEKKRKEKQQPKRDALTTLDEINTTIDKHSDEIGGEAVSMLHHYVDLAKEDVVRIKEESMSQISMLRVLASTGTMISVFDHEMSVIVRRMEEMASDLQSFLGSLPDDDRDRFRVFLAKMKEWIWSVRKLAHMIGLMLGKNARAKKINLSINRAVDEVFGPFRQYMKDNNIKPLNEVPPMIRTPRMYESELQSILVNLMTNSIKAFGRRENKRICVRAKESADTVSILFLDTGIGLSPDLWEEVFEPFVSYSVPSLDFGVGTGLGLTIVRDIVESYSGRVRFTLPPENWSTCLEIDLPKEM